MTGKVPKEFEGKILLALYRYYVEDVTFERVAEDANIPVYFFIQYVNDNELPMIHTEGDVKEGIKKVLHLMEKKGIIAAGLKVPA
jgi:hypothetical protein